MIIYRRELQFDISNDNITLEFAYIYIVAYSIG